MGMNAKPVGVSILTNGNRCGQLMACIDSLVANCAYRPLFIGVFDNGSTDDTSARMCEITTEQGVMLMAKRSPTDLGCAAGTNASIDMLKQCRFQIHLESDFILLPPEESGMDKMWLHRALALLASGECDYLYLRRMRNEREMARHWWSQWMPRVDKEQGEFLRCPNFWWSNNPTLFNVEAMYKSGVLPLDASKDGPKGTPGWSQPELKTARPQKAWLHRWGLFVHEKQQNETFTDAGCGRYGPYGKSGCKYGFWKDGKNAWCQACDASKDFRDLPAHEARHKSGARVTVEKPKESTSMVTIFTIDNGWGLADFMNITASFTSCRKLMVKKGVSPLANAKDIEIVPYTDDLTRFADGNHIGFFPRIGPANFDDFKRLVAMGVPIVANIAFHRDVIQHEKNGFIYQVDNWAKHWLALLVDNPNTRSSFLVEAKPAQAPAPAAAPVPVVAATPAPAPVVSDETPPLVTIITPTFRRDPKIVRRCINCMQLQTVVSWEQLVCSDGMDEPPIRELITSLGDSRVTYTHTDTRKPSDFGNTVRATMLKRARGKYVLFCDDDNVILPTYLEVMTKVLDGNPTSDIAVCHIVHFGPLNEAEAGKPPKVLTGVPMKLYHIDPLQVVMKREVMQAIGWDTEHGYVADGVTLQKLGEGRTPLEVPMVLGFHL